MSVCLSVVCCQVEDSASGRSLAQRIPTEYDVSQFDREASTMKRPLPTVSCCTINIYIYIYLYIYIYFKHVIRLPINTGCSKSCLLIEVLKCVKLMIE